ncbi:MAG TPA: aminotransferase class I/II-fold pyridoxal phosphate-dependent enzyme [Pseudonocardiaceae bacterium]|jgi:cystathionine beta-lyase|nr:aminotransferase class I/II-fold pyridoxal phosphate-dependent enzyme [Pseudonocardiaceae bacterium]
MADDRPVVDSLGRLRERRSAKWRAHPADVLPLTIAEMDFSLAGAVRDVLLEAVELSDTGYPMVEPALGAALASFAGDRWAWVVDPSAVVAAPDVSVAVVQLLRVFARPGDSVVINPPVYPPFFDWVPESGTQVVEVPLTHDQDNGWRLDLVGLERAFANRPSAYLLCNPHNPVGRVHSPDELAAAVRLAARYQVPIISDEIHGPLTLPGATFTPLLTLPGAADVAVSIHSAGKAWNTAGLKCAMIVSGSAAMRAVTDRLPVENRFRVGHFGALATVAAFDGGRDWLDGVLLELDARRAQLGSLVAERLPMISWHPPEATYLAWLDCGRLGSHSEPYELFLERGRVAFEPGPRFGAAVGSGFVRLNFATSSDILDAAVDRMVSAIRTGPATSF